MRHLTRREWLSRSAAAAAVWSVGGFDHLLAQGEATLADTAHGRIRGMRVDGVHIFKGVPYGGPATGAGRFMPPTACRPGLACARRSTRDRVRFRDPPTSS